MKVDRKPDRGSLNCGHRHHRRTLAQRRQDQRGRGTHLGSAGVRMDRSEDYAIRSWHLLRERRSLRLRDRRPLLGDFRRARPIRRIGYVKVSGGGRGASTVGADRARPSRRSNAHAAASPGGRTQRDHRVEQRVEVPAPGSVPDSARSLDRRFQEFSPRIPGPRQRRNPA